MQLPSSGLAGDQNSTDCSADDGWPPKTRIPGEELKADGWEGKREVKEEVEMEEMVVEAVVDTTENEQMGMRRKNNLEAGRKTILEADDESDLKQMLESFIGFR